MKKSGLILIILVVISLFYGGFVLSAGNNNGLSQGSGDLILPLATEEPTATPKPIVFGLTAPKNNALLRDLTEPIRFQWNVKKNTLSYTFTLSQVSGTPPTLTPVDTVIVNPGTSCGQTRCTLNYEADALDNSVYSWTVEATLPGDKLLEPNNAPFVFTLNTEPIELVKNGGFENPTGNLNNAIPGSWQPINPSGERRECRADKLPVNVSGLCAYKSTSGPVALLNQSVASGLLKKLKIAGGDTLTVHANVQATSAVSTTSKLRILLQFANDTKQTINVPLDAAPGDVFAAITPKSTNIGGNKPVVTKITVQVVSASKFFIDDVSVILEPVEAILLTQDAAATSGDLRGK